MGWGGSDKKIHRSTSEPPIPSNPTDQEQIITTISDEFNSESKIPSPLLSARSLKFNT